MNSNPYSSGHIYFQDCNNWEDYTIKENDTLYNISVKFGVPIRMLMSCNKNINPYNLQTGQTIKVPGSKPEAVGCREGLEETYTIELRDTLYSISEQLETSVEELIQINPGIDPYNLKPGTKICVPKKNSSNNIRPMPTPASVTSSSDSQQSISEQNSSDSQYQNQTAPSSQSMSTNNNSQPIRMTPVTSTQIPTQNIPYSKENNYRSESINPNNHTQENISKNSSSHNNSSNFHIMHEMNSESKPSMNAKINSDMNMPNSKNSLSCPKDCIGKYYITQESDTLESILDSLDLTYAALAFSNPTIDFCNLYSGIKLCIPQHDMFKGCNSSTAYIIKNGDCLSSLSQRFNVPESTMLSANPFNKITDFSTPGIRICIPE